MTSTESLRPNNDAAASIAMKLRADSNASAGDHIGKNAPASPEGTANTATNHDLAAAISLKPPAVRASGHLPSPQVLASEPLF